MKENKAKKIIAILLGISACTNVVYAFQLNNTAVLISYVVSFVGIMYCTVCSKFKIRNFIKETPIFLKLYLIVCMLSGVLIPISFGFDIEAFSTFIKGIILLLSGYCIYVLVLNLKEELKYIIYGLLIGLIINILYSFLSLIAFNLNSYITLYNLFPQRAFYMCIKWGISYGNFPKEYLLYSYRAQGLFLEASHFTCFLITICLPVIISIKNKFFKLIFLISVLYLTMISATPNFIVLIIEFIVCYLISSHISLKKNNKTIKSSSAFIFMFLIVLSMLILVNINKIGISKYISNIDRAIETLNVSDKSNSQRFDGMKLGLKYFLENPLGIGYNLEPYMFSKTIEGYSLKSSFSYMIRLLLETGPLGLLSYVMLILNYVKMCFQKNKDKMQIALGASCLFCMISQFANGITMMPYIWLLFGIIQIYKDRRSQNEIM